MIKNLFTKHERRSMPGITKEQVMQGSGWYWRSRQFGVNYTSPYSLRCSQFYSRLGLRQSVDVWASDEGSNVAIDVVFSAELTDEGAVVGAVGAVLILPLAAVVGAVSYVEYERDAQRLMNEFWTYIFSFPSNPQPPQAPLPPAWAQQAPAAPNVRTCPACNATLDPDSKFCKHCGAKL